jgi:hypothetical protein
LLRENRQQLDGEAIEGNQAPWTGRPKG